MEGWHHWIHVKGSSAGNRNLYLMTQRLASIETCDHWIQASCWRGKIPWWPGRQHMTKFWETPTSRYHFSVSWQNAIYWAYTAGIVLFIFVFLEPLITSRTFILTWAIKQKFSVIGNIANLMDSPASLGHQKEKLIENLKKICEPSRIRTRNLLRCNWIF